MADARTQQKERTREALLVTAHGLFAERGYAAVALLEVSKAAGVTKGALYHHFPDGKVELFVAVLRRAASEVGDAVAAAAEHAGDGWEGLRAGCRAFLVHSTSPSVARVLLVDGPAVLGWSRWRLLDEESSGRHLSAALAELVADGTISPRPVEPLARLLSGAMNEAALWLVGDGTGLDVDRFEETTRQLDDLLLALRT